MSLCHLEQIIEAFQSNFYQTGKALMEIRDEALFRELLFDSFSDYVKTRWDMSRSQAYRLIDASMVIDNLSPIGDGILPQTESQARVLAKLSPQDQRRIWKEFIASGKMLTAGNLRELIRCKRVKTCRTNAVDIISGEFKAAVLAMLEQIRVAHDDNWQKTSKPAGLYWIRVMKDLILHEKR